MAQGIVIGFRTVSGRSKKGESFAFTEITIIPSCRDRDQNQIGIPVKTLNFFDAQMDGYIPALGDAVRYSTYFNNGRERAAYIYPVHTDDVSLDELLDVVKGFDT